MNYADKKRIYLFLVSCFVFLVMEQQVVLAKEDNLGMIEELEMEEIERIVEEMTDHSLSFVGLLRHVVMGEPMGDEFSWEKGIKKVFFEILKKEKNQWMFFLSFILFSSFCSLLSSAFQEETIGEITFYMIYLGLVTFLMKHFQNNMLLLETCLQQLVTLMKALLPSYFVVMTTACGIKEGEIFYEMMLLIIFVAEVVMVRVILPAIQIYVILEWTNRVTTEPFCTRFTALMKRGITWTLKTMTAAVFGVQLVQRMLAPCMDAMKRTLFGRTVESLPAVGNLFHGVTEMVIASAIFIKNCFGVVSLICFLLGALPPLLQFGILGIGYRCFAALIQPLADKRMVSCIHTMGEGVGMLFQVVMTVEILFFVTVAILANSLE